MTKKRRNVYLSDPQEEYLEAECKRLGISVTELLRRIIDQHREEQARTAKRQEAQA